MTRSLFSLKPPLAGARPAAPNGGPHASGGDGEPIPDDLMNRLKSATTTLPASVQPGQVRAIRPNQLVRVLTEALAPERRRFEEELSKTRQRARELEAELAKLREERKSVDETRRTELPRLANLVDQERTRVEELEGERDTLSARIAALQDELVRREAVATASLPTEEEAVVDEVLAGVQERLDAISQARPAGVKDATSAAPAAPAAPSREDVERLVGALLSSDARTARLAGLEQRMAELTGQPVPPTTLEESPAARAVAALVRATLDESRARADRLEARMGELLDVARGLHGALTEESRRRALLEGALRAAQARLAVLEQREPTALRLPPLTSVVRGDVGPLLDAMREESRRRDDSLEGRLQRLSLATRAALERMAGILDQALAAGLFDRDMPRIDAAALGASIADAVAGISGSRPRPLWSRDLALDEVRDELAREAREEDDDEAEPPADDGDDDPGPGRGPGGPGARGGPGPADDPAPLLGPGGPATSQGDDDPWHELTRSEGDSDERAALLDELPEDDDEEPASEEELATWFRPGKPGQTEEEREAEQLRQFELEPPIDPDRSPPETPAGRMDAASPVVRGMHATPRGPVGGDPLMAPPEAFAALDARARARDPTPPPEPTTADVGQLEGLNPALEEALRSQAELAAARERLEQRVRDAERALESEVWRGLATHRELVTARQRLEQLETKLATPPEPPTARFGGFEPIKDVGPLRDEATAKQVEEAAVLSLDVEDRDSWVHWLLLEQDPLFRGTRTRAAQLCADAVRSGQLSTEQRDELLNWIDGEAQPGDSGS